ncbi:MAG: Orotate phosphoribosyltransferase, partial [Alphaproteobacteria bacterium MarineAlpha5_Bin1]
MSDTDYQNTVAEILINIGSVRFSFENPFILTSGLKSPVYVDCRKIISFVNERNTILNLAIEYFKNNNINFDILAGGETAGIPYAAFFSELLQKPMIYVRKKTKGFGKDQQIEGSFKKNQKTILIEDLATDGGSKVIFIEALRKAELLVSDIFVVFYYDIFDINNSPLSSLDVKIHSLCTWK